MLHSPNMMPSFTCPLRVQRGGGRRPGSLADAPQDCSTSEAFSPRTVLTENICRCVQRILQHFPTTMAFLTASTITFSWMASTTPQADSWWLGHVEPDNVVIADIGGQALDIFLHGPETARKNGIVKTFIHTSIPIHPCTLKKKSGIFSFFFFLFFFFNLSCMQTYDITFFFFFFKSFSPVFSFSSFFRSLWFIGLLHWFVCECVCGGRGYQAHSPYIHRREMRYGVESIHDHTQLQ